MPAILIPTFRVPDRFRWMNVETLCANYATNYPNDARMTARARVLASLANGLNWCIAHVRRVVFGKAQPFGDIPTDVDVSPQYVWRHNDYIPQAYRTSWRALAVPAESLDNSSEDMYAIRFDNSLASDDSLTLGGDQFYTGSPAATMSRVETSTFYRGAASNSELTEGVGTFNGYRLHDIVVQEQSTLPGGDAEQLYIPPPTPAAGEPILDNYPALIRSKLHKLRKYSLPTVATWSAAKGSEWSTAQSNNDGDVTGVHIVDDQYRNMLDLFRTPASTPPAADANHAGFPAFVKKMGIGDETLNDDNKKLRVQCRAYATADNGTPTSGNATICFRGPDTFTNNYVEIDVDFSAGPNWVGTSSDFIYLDTSVNYDDTTASRAKISVYGKVNDATDADHLYIYGVYCFADYHNT